MVVYIRWSNTTYLLRRALPHTATHCRTYCRTLPYCLTATQSIRKFISIYTNSHKCTWIHIHSKYIHINLYKFFRTTACKGNTRKRQLYVWYILFYLVQFSLLKFSQIEMNSVYFRWFYFMNFVLGQFSVVYFVLMYFV